MFTSNWRGRAAVIGTLLLTVATALSACSSGSSGASASQGGITGTIRVSALTGQPYLQDAANAFEKAHPGVHVQLVESPSNTYQTTVRAQLAANHAPDVMFVWGGSGNAMAVQELAKAELLEDLSSHPWVSKIGDTANSLVSNGGKVYALNTYENPTGVFYNKDLMNKLGVSVPKTFSDLLSWCKTVSSKGTIPIALGNQTGYLNIEVPLEIANSLSYSQDPNFGKEVSSGNFNWTNSSLWKDSLTKGLQEYMQMNDAKCFEPNSTGYSDTQANDLVSSGKALGVDIISAAVPTVKKGNPQLKYDMFEIPATDNANDTYLTANTGAAYAVNKASTNLAAANAFIDFMGEDSQLGAASQANFGVPYAPTKDTQVQEDMQGISSLYSAGKTALWQTNFWPNANVKQTMIAQDENLILGKTDIPSVVAAVQKSMNGS